MSTECEVLSNGVESGLGRVADKPLTHVSPRLSREQLLDLRILLMEAKRAEREFAHAVELHIARLGLDPAQYALNMQTGAFEVKT